MVFFIDPDRTFFQGPHVLSKYPELDDAGANSPGVGGNDNVSLALLGRGQCYDLPVSLPF